MTDEEVEGDEILGCSKDGSARSLTSQQIANLGGGGSGTVESVTGDGVDNTDPDNPVLTFPEADEVVFTPAGNIAATDVQAAIEDLGNADIDRASSALTDSSTIAITGTKHTLTSAEAAVTWSYTFTGEEMKVLITLNLDAADYTFPSGTLCIVDGDATGDNTAPLFGTSGDKYLLVVTKFGSAYVAVIKNIGQ